MQAVQLQQILPQIQQAPAQKPAQSAESTSFMDELKARFWKQTMRNSRRKLVRVRRFQPHLSPAEIAKNKFN